jgi:hypothetical protein
VAVEALELVTHLLVVLAAAVQAVEILLLVVLEVMALEILAVAVEALVVVPTSFHQVPQVLVVQVK